MKKYILLHVGYVTPTEEIKQAWGRWFATMGDKFVDTGNPLSPGKEVTAGETKDLPHDRDAITGYSIINAESIEEAEQIARSCPMITSMRVYEAMLM